MSAQRLVIDAMLSRLLVPGPHPRNIRWTRILRTLSRSAGEGTEEFQSDKDRASSLGHVGIHPVHAAGSQG
jgi:hypothetical protein